MAPQPLPDLPESAKRSAPAPLETPAIKLRSDRSKLREIVESAEEVGRVADQAMKHGK